VPLATTEGTLVASYNRGMRVITAAGGAKVTVVDDAMQRAPVFIFEDARQARQMGEWIEDNFAEIKSQAETTTQVGQLRNIEQYAAARMRYLRFNFTTGDAAGQNMVSKACFAACEWIKVNYPYQGLQRYTLSGAMDTDKKHSQLNTLHSRGKRVIAEVTISDQLLRENLGVSADMLFKMRQISNVGSMMAGSVNNGAHSPNAIAAMFIACGQDAANVAESSSAISFVDVDSEGKVKKLAEIIGATVLAGELSLSAAVLAGDWVSSHDNLGRNR
jgi:hydroxymethylglutaryl-CoA reductase (NADPH)